MHSVDDLFVCSGDFNGHIDGFYVIHGGLWCRSEEFGWKDAIRVLPG